MRERFKHMHMKGGKKIEIEELIESYVMQCENAIESGKREHLPKILQTKFDKEKRERQDKARAKANSPGKPAETARPTPTVTKTNATTTIMAVARTKVKEGAQQIKQNEKHGNAEQVVAIESDAVSNSGLMIDEPAEEMSNRSAGTASTVQKASANTSASPVAKDVPIPLEVKGEEEVE